MIPYLLLYRMQSNGSKLKQQGLIMTRDLLSMYKNVTKSVTIFKTSRENSVCEIFISLIRLIDI